MSNDCVSSGQLAGAIIGAIVGTLIICTAAAGAIWFFLYRHGASKAKQILKQNVDVESRAVSAAPGTPKKTMRDQVTMIDSFKVDRRSFGTQKSFSTENVNAADGSVGVQLHSDNLSGLGFDIKGNMTEGIFVKSVRPRGPADLCGNVLVDDRIRSLTICFDEMVYSDAVTLLSYASPYKVKLVLERKLDGGESPLLIDSNPALTSRIHPLFRSNTLTHCHFSPISNEPSTRTPSPPQQPTPPPSEEDVVVSVDERRQEERATAHATVKVREEKSASAKKEVAAPKARSPPPPPKEIEEDSIRKMTSSDYSSENSFKSEETPSVEESIGSVSSISEKAEMAPPPPAHGPRPVSATPPKQTAEKQPPKKPASILRQPSQSAIPMKMVTQRAPPEIAETRVSRIPKRGDQMLKTPVVERKLPALPKSALQKREDEPKSGDIWSRLYQEKKGALRKTPSRAQDSPSRALSPPGVKDNINYGTLNRERRERLNENDEILERQREELRQLGVL